MDNSFINIPNISVLPIEDYDNPYNFKLDPFQQHAISAICKDENVLVCANSYKIIIESKIL
jgi:superfamily II RNA helicase